MSTVAPGKRPPEEVRRLLTESASSMFAARGYAGTTTKGIAAHAGVAESVLFRHFGTKANLFTEAAVRPFVDAVEELRQSWRGQLDAGWDDEATLRAFLGGLYDRLASRRDAVAALLAMQRDPDASHLAVAALDRVEAAFADLTAIASVRARLRVGAPPKELALTLRLFVAMVAAAVVHDGVFLRSRPSRARVVDELVAVALHGVTSAARLSQ